MKREPGEPIVILGSADGVSQLAAEGLIDEYQIALTPVVLGAGMTMFCRRQKKLRAEAEKLARLQKWASISQL